MIVHSECGGELFVDHSVRTELGQNGNTTDIYYGITCRSCGAKLGLLSNVCNAFNSVKDIADYLTNLRLDGAKNVH